MLSWWKPLTLLTMESVSDKIRNLMFTCENLSFSGEKWDLLESKSSSTPWDLSYLLEILNWWDISISIQSSSLFVDLSKLLAWFSNLWEARKTILNLKSRILMEQLILTRRARLKSKTLDKSHVNSLKNRDFSRNLIPSWSHLIKIRIR
jgi:hypothetical protein